MLKAVLDQGVIRPLEPLPAEWANGMELNVTPTGAEVDDLTDEEAEAVFAELAVLCANNSEDDHRRMMHVINEQRRISKEQMRRQQGLG